MPRGFFFLFLALLAGCNMAPKHVRPAAPIAPAYPHEFAGDVTLGRRATEIGWRDFFADPRLEALVAAALERNRDLAIAVARIEEARGLYRIQRADRLPLIGATAEATRTRTSGGFTNGSGAPPAPGTGTGGSAPATFNRFAITAELSSFELDFWGRVKNLSQAARADYLATAEAERAFRLTLIRDVANAYFDSREAEERIAVAESAVAGRRDGLRIARRRLDAGVTSALDFRQAETLLTQAETALAALRQARAVSDNLLITLVGGPIDGVLPAPLPLASQAGPPIAPGLPSEVLVARPDILAAEERLRAARYNVGAARAAFFPTISLTGSLGLASSSLANLVGTNGLNWSIGPRIELPFLNFGRAKANLTVAEAREDIAVATYERTVQTAFQEVADALAGRKYLAEQVDAQARGTEAQRRIVALARARYREGVANYLEVLDAERNLFDAEQALLQLRRALADNLVSLYVALGGGGFADGPSPERPAAR
jgi:multidrug efflux system outer membrane protein